MYTAKPANVVVVHNHMGIDVVHLLTGRRVTFISLPEPRAGGVNVYADINGDRVIDQVHAVPGRVGQELDDEMHGLMHGMGAHHNISCRDVLYRPSVGSSIGGNMERHALHRRGSIN